MKRILPALAAFLFLTCPAQAQMMPGMAGRMGMPGMTMGMGATSMPEHLGPGLMAACMVDLGDLGLPADARKSLEEKKFELQKKAIRGMADLRILKMEAARLLEKRDFDLAAASKKLAEISQKEAELRSAHIEYLHDLGAVLTDEQWNDLTSNRPDLMPMMDRMMMERGGMMRGEGGMMMDGMTGGQGGMMMDQAPEGGQDRHHPGDPKEAEKFFEEKK